MKTFNQHSVTGILLHHFGVSSFEGHLCVHLLGEHRVPKGLKHALHWWAFGGYRGGKLEPAQAHCPASPAPGWCSPLPVRQPLCLCEIAKCTLVHQRVFEWCNAPKIAERFQLM